MSDTYEIEMSDEEEYEPSPEELEYMRRFEESGMDWIAFLEEERRRNEKRIADSILSLSDEKRIGVKGPQAAFDEKKEKDAAFRKGSDDDYWKMIEEKQKVYALAEEKRKSEDALLLKKMSGLFANSIARKADQNQQVADTRLQKERGEAEARRQKQQDEDAAYWRSRQDLFAKETEGRTSNHKLTDVDFRVNFEAMLMEDSAEAASLNHEVTALKREEESESEIRKKMGWIGENGTVWDGERRTNQERRNKPTDRSWIEAETKEGNLLFRQRLNNWVLENSGKLFAALCAVLLVGLFSVVAIHGPPESTNLSNPSESSRGMNDPSKSNAFIAPGSNVMTENHVRRTVDHMVKQGADRAESETFTRTLNQIQAEWEIKNKK